jgi:hypothetical protein
MLLTRRRQILNCCTKRTCTQTAAGSCCSAGTGRRNKPAQPAPLVRLRAQLEQESTIGQGHLVNVPGAAFPDLFFCLTIEGAGRG